MKQDYPCLAIEESAPLDTELFMSYSITLPSDFGTKNDIPITTINNRGMPQTPFGPTWEIVRPPHSAPATKANQTSRSVLVSNLVASVSAAPSRTSRVSR